MSFKVSILGLACLLLAVFATTAEAQRSYPLTGNARVQIGDGLPVPIGFTAAPNGKIAAIAGARLVQSSGPDPKQMTIPTGQFHFQGPDFNLPVFAFNSAVFQVKTNVTIDFPGVGGGTGAAGSGLTFMAGGRTGAATVTWCPGQAITPSSNPACVDPGTPQHGIAGFLRYTSTGNQFGGPIRGNAAGTADVGIRAAVANVSGPLPCDHALPTTVANGAPCRVAFALATPDPTGLIGGPFANVATTPGAPPPAPGGVRNAKVGPGGTVLSVTSPGLGEGVANPATNFGGPYTTGMVTVNQSAALGTAEVFVLTGSDARVDGVGTISLVAGGLSDRVLTGPNANRAWLNMTVGGNTPGLSSWGVGVLALLLASAGVWRARRATTS
ncbi:MAG: hypothetical protein AAEJ52_16520 [Myxococcota bacterium]